MTGSSPTYLVIGGTGKTGRRVQAGLEADGLHVRAVSRSSNPRFEWNDPSTWEAVLTDVERVYITYAPDLAIPGAVEAVSGFVDLAVEAGVKRVVLLSGRGEEEAQRAEKVIQRPELEWTVVRASWFFQNFSEGPFRDMVLDGVVYLPADKVREPFVDVGDIAEVVVKALTEDGHHGEVYEVTGPRLMTFGEAIEEVSAALDRPVRYQPIPNEAFVSGLKEAGLPDGVVWLMDYLFTTVLDGRNEYLADGIPRALGRPSTDFSEFASEAVEKGHFAKV